MTRKLNALFAITLAIILCLGGLAAAFAQEEENPITGEAVEGTPARAAITKLLKLPIGTDAPETTFEFQIKAISVDEVNNDGTNMPQISNVILPVAVETDGSNVSTKDNITTVFMQSGDVFGAVKWEHAGIYVYEITEVKDTFQYNVTAGATSETMTYSDAKYTMIVYVKEDETPKTFYVAAVGAVVTVTDNDNQVENRKVDPTPGLNGKYSQMTFTNTYVKTNGGTNPLNDATLSVSKEVKGEYASKDLYFDYSLTVTAPSLATGSLTYKAYVVADGQIVTSALNGAENDNNYIEFQSGTATSFSLKHDQKLVFIDTPVGSGYDITESAADAYKPSVTIVYNETSVNEYTAAETGDPLTVTSQLIGEKTNSARFINTRDTVSLTGLNMNDLPFIAMIILALAAIAGYIVLMRRREETV